MYAPDSAGHLLLDAPGKWKLDSSTKLYTIARDGSDRDYFFRIVGNELRSADDPKYGAIFRRDGWFEGLLKP